MSAFPGISITSKIFRSTFSFLTACLRLSFSCSSSMTALRMSTQSFFTHWSSWWREYWRIRRTRLDEARKRLWVKNENIILQEGNVCLVWRFQVFNYFFNRSSEEKDTLHECSMHWNYSFIAVTVLKMIYLSQVADSHIVLTWIVVVSTIAWCWHFKVLRYALDTLRLYLR